MTTVQIIEGDFNIISPGWPRYEFDRAGDVLISDDFTRAGWLGGQDTDSKRGGTNTTWVNGQYVSQVWEVTGGRAVSSKAGTVFLLTPQQNYDVEVAVDSLPTNTSDVVNVQARRTADTQHYVTAVIKGNGELTLKTYDGSSIRESSPASRLIKAGDLVTLRVVESAASVLINGVSVLSEQVEVWESDRIALNTATATGAKLGHIRVIAR